MQESALPSFRTSEARSRRPRCLEEDTPVSSFVFHDTIEGPRASAVRGVSLQLQLPMPLPQLPRPHGLFPLPLPPPRCCGAASPFISLGKRWDLSILLKKKRLIQAAAGGRAALLFCHSRQADESEG
jgi:hypothetical protein